MARIMTKLRRDERLQDTHRLRSPQIFPMVGDGFAASSVTRALRGGPDSYLKRNRHGKWGQQFIVPTRVELVEARYRDWLDSRDQRIAA